MFFEVYDTDSPVGEVLPLNIYFEQSSFSKVVASIPLFFTKFSWFVCTCSIRNELPEVLLLMTILLVANIDTLHSSQ